MVYSRLSLNLNLERISSNASQESPYYPHGIEMSSQIFLSTSLISISICVEPVTDAMYIFICSAAIAKHLQPSSFLMPGYG
jgi:hypothetical protein